MRSAQSHGVIKSSQFHAKSSHPLLAFVVPAKFFLKYHLFNTLRIGYTNECQRGIIKMTAKNLLEECPTYTEQIKLVWFHPLRLRTNSMEMSAASD